MSDAARQDPPLWRRVLRRGLLVNLSVGFLLLLVFCACFAGWVAPSDPTTLDVRQQLCAPDATHWLGCDENGRDVLTLLIYGSRVTLIVGLASVGVSLMVGMTLGAISGFYGRWADEIIMRLTEIVFAFPGILLAILIIFLTQEPNVLSVIFALSATGWAGYARLVRGEVLRERSLEYVEAAHALGLSRAYILRRHIIPNILAPVIVQATFGIAGAILAESALSFLGLGPSLSAFWGASWGQLLDQGATFFLLTPHLAIAPGIAIMLTVLAVNIIGDALRDELDPTLQHVGPS